MILVIVAIRDRALNAYGRPIFVHSVGQAVRSFSDEVNRVSGENEMNKHPEDFDLYELGSYDDQTGKVVSLEQPRQIAVGKEQVVPGG